MSSPLERELIREAEQFEQRAKTARDAAKRVADQHSVARVMFTSGDNIAPQGYQVLVGDFTVRVGSVVRAATLMSNRREGVVIGFGVVDELHRPSVSHISAVDRY